VAEALTALGADAVFGLPGVHALPIWEGMRRSNMRYLGLRTELCAGFAADGYARVSGRPAPLLLSTGPGALIGAAALMEAASSHVPVVAMVSQIPGPMIGRGRGYLHELGDQLGVFASIAKRAYRATSAESIPETIAIAWREALTPPSGPVYVEIPFDVLASPTAVQPVSQLDGDPGIPLAAQRDVLEHAAALLRDSVRPVVWAGSGVLRSFAWNELREVAEGLDAPVATTYMGKGAFPEHHPLAVGSACDEPAFRALLSEADVVLCVGTELGSVTTGDYSLEFKGKLIQIDAAPERIGVSYPAVPLVGDAAATLSELRARLPGQAERRGPERAGYVRDQVDVTLDGQSRRGERRLLRAIRDALPDGAVTAWDMTILGYWAAPDFPALTPRSFLHPLGSGTLGYAWPAAMGASVALPGTHVLAVVGDGGSAYGVAELASAYQNQFQAKLLVVDDGKYGILAKYQRQSYGEDAAFGVRLAQPDFLTVARAYSVPAQRTTVEGLEYDLSWLMAVDGPGMLVLQTELEAPDAT
jgi:acetolactate synthase I/II/III large subunit